MPEAPAPRRVPMLLCAIGLLLTIVEVRGFGHDFAGDTAGFLLLAVAGGLAGRSERWSRVLTGSAALAAAASLFEYGGPASLVLAETYRLWTAAAHVAALAAAGVVVALLMLVRGLVRDAARRSSPLSEHGLPAIAFGHVVAVACQLAAVSGDWGYAGWGSYLRQAVGVLVGLTQILTVIAAFAVSRSRT